MNPGPFRKLIKAAKKARTLAYCPYSGYPVGAAALTEKGRIFTGANVENASFGLSLCAERVAVFNAVSHGHTRIKALCVVCRDGNPCGACRQVISEFSTPNAVLILVSLKGGSRKETVTNLPISSLLPHPFNPRAAGLLKGAL